MTPFTPSIRVIEEFYSTRGRSRRQNEEQFLPEPENRELYLS
jgi:hypothetical protein